MSVSRIKRERFLTVYWLQYLSNARISLSFNKIDTRCLRGDGLVCSFFSAFIDGVMSDTQKEIANLIPIVKKLHPM